jgi:hypothetical protein
LCFKLSEDGSFGSGRCEEEVGFRELIVTIEEAEDVWTVICDVLRGQQKQGVVGKSMSTNRFIHWN